MRSIPVDTSRPAVAFIDAVPVLGRDRDSGTLIPGRQAADRDGVPVWHVSVLCSVEGEGGGETVRVRVSVGERPAFEPAGTGRVRGPDRPGLVAGRALRHQLTAAAIRTAGSPNGRTRQAAPAEAAS